MARGLTHPTAHVGKAVLDKSSNQEFIYEGFKFSGDISKLIKGLKIIREVGKPKKSGAMFYFTQKRKKYGIIYYASSVTSSSNINAGKLGLQYAGRKGATENLGIQADKLIAPGKFADRTLNGQKVKCGVFTSKKQLGETILKSLKTNKNVGPHIYDAVENYFKGNMRKIEWNDSFDPSEINEIGKYLGELFIGGIALGRAGGSTLSTNIFKTPVKEFIVPDDPSFSGVDSAIVLKTGEIIPISSKMGVGAKASIFTNFMPKVVGNSNLPTSVIKDLANSAKRAGVTKAKLDAKQGSKDIVYEYGVRDILKLKKSEVPDPYAIYTEIRSLGPDAKLADLSSEAATVVGAIKQNKDIPDNVKEALPQSVTSAFNREIARRLNEDKKSQDIVAKILAGKSFYQANLDIPKWKRGEVYFKLLLSGKANVSFIGSKAAINDIDAKQGLVNYELKYT